MKRAPLALRAAAAAVGLLVLGVVIGEISGWPFLRQPLQEAMARAAGVPVVLEGRFRTRLLWRPNMEVEHLNIAPGGQVAVPHLVDARNVELAWGWGDVWRWRKGETLFVKRLQAGVIDAHLVRGEDRRASWQLGQPKQDSPSKTDPLDGLPRFGALMVKQGLVVFDDALIDTKLRIDIAGSEGERLPDGTTAGYEATIKGRWHALPLQLKVRAGGSLPLLDDDADAPPVPLRVQGQAGASTLLFDGTAGALLGARRMDGALQFRGPSLAKVAEPLGLTLPQTPPFDLRGRLAHDGGRWHLRADRAHIGKSRLSGEFDYDRRPQRPKLTGKLMGTRLALSDLGPAVGTPGTGDPGTAAVKPPPGRVLPNRKFDIPSLRAMDANVQVAIDELNFGTDDVSSLRHLRTVLLLDAGVLRLQNLQASVAGGTFGGDTQLDGNGDPARWQADMRFNTIDVAGWLPGLKSAAGKATESNTANKTALKNRREQARAGGEQPVKSYLTGTLSGHVKVTGAGRSTADILGSLDGTARIMLRDGTLSHLATEAAGIDLAQALGVLIRGDQPLPLNCARLDLTLKDGLVTPRVAVLDNDDTTIRIDGRLNLRDETLALRAVARPKDFSPLALRTPVTVGGTLADPVVGIEGGKLAGKAAAAVALGAVVAPLAALLPFMDRGNREDDPCTDGAAQAAAKTASTPATGDKRRLRTANGK